MCSNNKSTHEMLILQHVDIISKGQLPMYHQDMILEKMYIQFELSSIGQSLSKEIEFYKILLNK